MSELSLLQALEWVAFGNEDVSIPEKMQQKYKMEKATESLRHAFISGKVSVKSDGIPLCVKNTYGFDWENSIISPFEEGVFYLPLSADKKNITVSFEDLKREFPLPIYNQTVKINSKKELLQRRPSTLIVHDLAYYLWEKEQNLSAKEIYRIINAALSQYPKFKSKTEVAKYNTVAKWLTNFRNGTYKPENTKDILIKQFPGVFEKMRNSRK